MDTYTVLLVDDEEEVIRVIMKKTDWEGLGFSVIGYANNGARALEMVEEFQPDVVMTDIRMPYMDGLELAGRIKAEYPMTRILFFTGFDEFEYAREAVRLEVEEYLLKPVSSAGLTSVFAQLKKKIDQEIREKKNAEILQKYYLESLPVMQANFYSSLIEGRIREEEIPRYLSDYQITLPGPCYCCLVFHISSGQAPEELGPVLLNASVRRQALERLGEKWQVESFPYLGNIVLIVQMKSEQEIQALTDECDRFCRYFCHIIGAVVTVGIGPVCSSLTELSGSYSGAREAVSYRVIYGVSRAINLKEIVPGKAAGTDAQSDALLTALFKTIRLGSGEETVRAVDKYLRQMSFQDQSLQQYQIHLMELLSALYRFVANHDITSDPFSGDMRMLCNSLLDLEPDALRKWLVDISLSFREELICARSRSTRSLVSGAKEYVHQNYQNAELSLDGICQVLGVSNSYFSTIFKKKTGKSFIAYLTDYRMEQASRLLIETDEKSYVIAKRVGYLDPNYFSYVFKKHYGLSPSRYRTEHGESEK